MFRAKKRFFTIGLCLTSLFALVLWVACSDDRGLNAPPNAPVEPATPATSDIAGDALLAVGPIEGLTTVWHAMPERVVAPVGADLVFRCRVPSQVVVRWDGATESGRTENGSFASYRVEAAGLKQIEVRLADSEDDQLSRRTRAHTIIVEGVDVSGQGIRVEPISASAAPIELDESTPSREAMRYLFGGSTGEFEEIGPASYRTSVDREIDLRLEVTPAAFAPMIEWRIDRVPVSLGDNASVAIDQPGLHVVSAGPPGLQAEIRITTYEVFVHGPNAIPAGEPVTFSATTRPRGFEDRITWVAGSLYGTATPVLGKGASFVVQFDNVIGPNQDQCYGVRADNQASIVDVLTPNRCIYVITCIKGSLNCADCATLVGDSAYANVACLGDGDCLQNAANGCVEGTTDCPSDPLGKCTVGLQFVACKAPGAAYVSVYDVKRGKKDCFGVDCVWP